MTTDIGQRKTDHIDLAVSGDVGFHRTTTLFECVRLVHNALPDLHADQIDLSVKLLGKTLKAPVIIAAMTGGTARAGEINRQLAAIAEQRGYGFGLGSQRAMFVDESRSASFKIRDVAPNALLLGNVGVVQARAMSVAQLEDLVNTVGADALCVHLNPAMEMVQPGGDRDFSGGLDTLAKLSAEISRPVIAKETGCGLSTSVAERLISRGIRHVDVSGAGGTSWVAVETHRASGAEKALGQAFWDWGIPTAASVAWVARYRFDTIIATGGVSSGLDAAKAIALGASAAGIARPVLQALENEGVDGVHKFLDQVEAQLRVAMLLVGAKSMVELQRAPRVVVGELRDWMRMGGNNPDVE